MTVDEITLPRSGAAPLRFRGELLAESDGERRSGREQTRWHELAVYRTAGDRYVVRITYRTRYQGEPDVDVALVTDAAGVAAALESHDPCAAAVGYPPGEHYAERQRRLLEDLRRRYAAQVSEVLAADPAFAEDVP
jgi:hypothetical protein